MIGWLLVFWCSVARIACCVDDVAIVAMSFEDDVPCSMWFQPQTQCLHKPYRAASEVQKQIQKQKADQRNANAGDDLSRHSRSPMPSYAESRTVFISLQQRAERKSQMQL